MEKFLFYDNYKYIFLLSLTFRKFQKNHFLSLRKKKLKSLMKFDLVTAGKVFDFLEINGITLAKYKQNFLNQT